VKNWPDHKIPCKETPTYKANREVATLKMKLAEKEATLGVDHEETLSTVDDIGLGTSA